MTVNNTTEYNSLSALSTKNDGRVVQNANEAANVTNEHVLSDKDALAKSTQKTNNKLSNELSSNFNKMSVLEMKETNINQEKIILDELSSELESISDFTQIKEKIRQYQIQIKDNFLQKEYNLTNQEDKLFKNIENIEKTENIVDLKADINSRIEYIQEEEKIISNNKQEVISQMSNDIKAEIEVYELKSKQFDSQIAYNDNSDMRNLTNIAGYVMVALSNASPSNSIKLLS